MCRGLRVCWQAMRGRDPIDIMEGKKTYNGFKIDIYGNEQK